MPVLLLKTYNERTKSLRRDKEELFVTYREGKSSPASKDTIARWIVSTIKQAYDSRDIAYHREPSAQDTRKLAISWALVNGASVKEILHAAHWSQESLFKKFYLKDVSREEGNFTRASI